LFFSALLAQLDVRNIDRHNKWFSIDAGVFLASEYAVHRRKLDPGHLYIGIDIACAGCASGDFDIVVVTLQEPILIEMENLPGTVGCDAIGKADLQASTALSVLTPRRKLFASDVHIAQPAK
jgi:hypothetical protein